MAQIDRYSPEQRERWAAFIRSLNPHSDPRAARLMDDFHTVGHQIYQLNEAALASADLSYAEFRVLMNLMFCEWAGECDGLNPSVISAHQGTSRNTISALIRNLEEKKLVARQLDENDRRRFRIHLTDAGRSKVLAHSAQIGRLIDQLFGALSDAEVETLSGQLRALDRRAQAIKE